MEVHSLVQQVNCTSALNEHFQYLMTVYAVEQREGKYTRARTPHISDELR